MNSTYTFPQLNQIRRAVLIAIHDAGESIVTSDIRAACPSEIFPNVINSTLHHLYLSRLVGRVNKLVQTKTRGKQIGYAYHITERGHRWLAEHPADPAITFGEHQRKTAVERLPESSPSLRVCPDPGPRERKRIEEAIAEIREAKSAAMEQARIKRHEQLEADRYRPGDWLPPVCRDVRFRGRSSGVY